MLQFFDLNMLNDFFQKSKIKRSRNVFASLLAIDTTIGRLRIYECVNRTLFGKWTTLAKEDRKRRNNLWSILAVNIAVCSKLCQSRSKSKCH